MPNIIAYSKRPKAKAVSPIYLDYAAATPLDSTVLAAMQPYLTTEFYNPSATYNAGRSIRTALEDARRLVAECLGARSSEIIFTAGGTEAINLAIHGVMSQYPGAKLVTSAIEHSAALKPAANYIFNTVDVNVDGIVDPLQVAAAIDDNTVLVSLMYANNEIGTVQPLRAVAQQLAIIRKQRLKNGNRLPLLLHSDACQAPNYLDIHAARLGVDLMSLNGSKLYGPKQSGALFIKGGVILRPLIEGGGQERGLRSGTENVAGAIGFATALRLAQQLRPAETTRLQALQANFIAQLEAVIPTLQLNGSRRHRLPNNVHITVPGIDNERLLVRLDELGIMAAAGSACSASSHTPSTVLSALGLTDKAARSSVRFSFGRQTTAQQLERVVQVLAQLTN